MLKNYPEPTTQQQTLWHDVLNGLPGFLASWAAQQQQSVSYQQWRDCQYLFAMWQQQRDWPDDVAGYGLRLRPLLCHDAERQQDFMAFWLNHYATAKIETAPVISDKNARIAAVQQVNEQAGKTWFGQTQQRLNRQRRRVVAMFLLIVLVICGGAYYYFYVQQTPKPPVKQAIEIPGQPITTKPEDLRLAPNSDKPYLNTVPLRQPPPYFHPDAAELQQGLYAMLAIASLLLAIPLGWLWHRRRVMFQHIRQRNNQEQDLALKAPIERMDGLLSRSFKNLLGRLRFTKSEDKRINWHKTALATAKNANFPVLKYNGRHRQADFVLIADRRHRDDQSAWLIGQLQDALKQAQIRVHRYEFDRHPEWLWRHKQHPAKPETLTQALLLHAGSRVLLVVEHDVLFYRFTGELQAWLKNLHGLKNFQLGLLSQPDARQVKLLELGHYHYRLISNLSDLSPLLDSTQENAKEKPTQQPDFRSEWLGNLRPKQPQAVLDWIKEQHGEEVLRFLALLALYPRLQGDLSHAIFRYFASTAVEKRLSQAILLKTIALPWCRQGWLPSWLRDTLTQKLAAADHRHAQQFFVRLFDSDQHKVGLDVKLPLSKPQGSAVWWWLLLVLRLAKHNSPLRDGIFARLLLLPSASWLKLILPRRLLNALPNLLLSVWPARLALTAVMVAYFITNLWLWQQYGQPWYAQRLLAAYQTENANKLVTIAYHPKAEALVEVLGRGLNSLGYGVAKRLDDKISKNQIDAPAEIVSELANTAKHMTWGIEFEVLTDTATPTINLANLPQTGQVFRDVQPASAVSGAYPATASWQKATTKTVVITPPIIDTRIKPIPPKMVTIPAGQFLMGSPTSEKNSNNDERPQHKVNVPTFYMAETELTFAEWDQCVAALACREIDDQGWGREQRPVMNVSWNDADTYIKWLNSSEGLTGAKTYRLPTEAEWEYAARAGNQTPYFWGKASRCDYANGYDDGYCNDEFQYTAPVKSFKSNAWSLFDMSGNVWEWVEDCWKENYQSTITVDNMSLSSKCDKRSVRGGGWNDIARNLRSASRDWYKVEETYSGLGFRLARTN